MKMLEQLLCYYATLKYDTDFFDTEVGTHIDDMHISFGSSLYKDTDVILSCTL